MSSGAPNQEELLLQTVLRGLREVGDWPRFRYVHLLLEGQGVEAPAECLRLAPKEHVRFDEPLDDGIRCRATAAGIHIAEPHAPELHSQGFVGVLRRCVDFYGTAAPSSASAVEPIVAPAREVWPNSKPREAEMRRVGRLLEVEGIGRVEWSDDRTSPWSIELNFQVRRWAPVGHYRDYARIRTKSDSPAATAA